MSVQTEIDRIITAVGAAYDAVEAKGGTAPAAQTIEGLAAAVGTISTGGSSALGAPGDITFYDYDGTIVTSWTLEELATKTALPDYPSHNGLTCQGWNWSLAGLKTTNRKMNVGAMYITDDGKTRIYIRLEEGRTSPMLGVCPNGTVTVDWGDGTTPDTLTGTDVTTVKWTPNHAYAVPGEYVIKLTVDGTMGFYGEFSLTSASAILRYSSSDDNRNYVYRSSVQKIEIGNGITSIDGSSFYSCYSLASITMPNSITSIKESTFYSCYSLTSITIPDSVTNIGNSIFNSCYSLASITIPNGIASVGDSAFHNCRSLASITIPNGITSVGDSAFKNCRGVVFYDFTACTTVPTLASTTAFTGIPADCKIRIPAALVNAWKAATNWATYADHIVGV